MQTENKNTEAILVLERQIYNYQRANAELQTSLGERSLMQKYGLYLLLVGWFLALEFMKTGTDAMNSGSRLRHSEGECDQY